MVVINSRLKIPIVSLVDEQFYRAKGDLSILGPDDKSLLLPVLESAATGGMPRADIVKSMAQKLAVTEVANPTGPGRARIAQTGSVGGVGDFDANYLFVLLTS